MTYGIADGLNAAFDDFSKQLQQIGRFDQTTANKVAAFYLRHKLAKLDHIMACATVKHGALLDPQTVKNAGAYVNGAR